MSRELSLVLVPAAVAVLLALVARAKETHEAYAGQPGRQVAIVLTVVLLLLGIIFGSTMAGDTGDAPAILVGVQMLSVSQGLLYLALPLIFPLIDDVAEAMNPRARGVVRVGVLLVLLTLSLAALVIFMPWWGIVAVLVATPLYGYVRIRARRWLVNDVPTA